MASPELREHWLPPKIGYEASVELHGAMLADDPNARERLILGNMQLAWWIVRRRYRIAGRMTDDAMAIAFECLVDAVDRWEPTKGRLSTLLNLIAPSRIARMKFGIHAPFELPRQVAGRAMDRWGEIASGPEALAIYAGDGQDFRFSCQTDRRFRLEDDPEARDEAIDLRDLLRRLDGRSRSIVAAYYGLDGETPASFAALSGRFGVSASRLQWLVDRALTRMRNNDPDRKGEA